MAEQYSSAPTASAGATWRAVVMLLCLVALPLMALRGTTLSNLTKTVPEVARKLLDGRWKVDPVAITESRPEAPRFQPSVPPPPSPASQSPFALAENRGDSRHSEYDPNTAPRSLPRRLALAPCESPGDEAPPAAVNRRDPFATPRFNSVAPESGDVRRASLVPVARRDRGWANSPVDSPPLQNAVIRPETKPERTTSDPPDRFTYVADRLRELGAVYYLLETWGSERFRFHCKMAIGGNPGYTRHFEATDRDALQAMGRVLSDVETWRAVR